MSRNKKELIANFRQLTGSQQAAAEDYLTRANWDFNQAANLFFEQGASNPNSSINPATLFDIYKNEESKIDTPGLVGFLNDIGVDPTSDPLCGYLLLLMKCQASDKVEAEEFNRLCYHLKYLWIEIKAKIPELRSQLDDPLVFRQVYMYLFELYKENSKFMKLQIAMALWRVYLEKRFRYYREFLEFMSVYDKMVTRDIWRMVLEFEKETQGDLGKYFEKDGWPIIIDNFVEHLRANK